MDDASLYKAKEEITEFCTTYIDKKFELEKGLIKDYIGLGLKVALGGVGIAVVTAGFFGWKSYDDMSKSVQTEIKARFNSENPIVKYENLIKESSIDGVIAALTVRINSNDRFFSSDDSLSFLVRMLQDDGVSVEKKTAILQFAKIVSVSNGRMQIARAARKLIQADYKDNRESGVRLMSRLIELYSVSDAKQFVTDALNILDNHKDEIVIVQNVARMLDKLDPNDATRVLAKVGSATDQVSKFHIQLFDLRTKAGASLDKEWLSSVIQDSLQQRSFRDRSGVSPIDLLAGINSLEADNKNFWSLCDAFAKEASAKGYSIEYQTNSFDSDSVRASPTLSSTGYSIFFSRSLYTDLVAKVSKAFLSRSMVFAKPTDDDLSTMSFWMIKQPNSGREDAQEAIDGGNRAYFFYRGGDEIKNEAGSVVASERMAKRLAIRIERLRAKPVIGAYWRDAAGALQTAMPTSLQGLERKHIELRTGFSFAGMDDDL